MGHAKLYIYSPNKPLSSGAKVCIETLCDVEIVTN